MPWEAFEGNKSWWREIFQGNFIFFIDSLLKTQSELATASWSAMLIYLLLQQVLW